MIQNKFSKMVVKAWESDTLNYATTGSIDNMIATLNKEDSKYYEKMQKIIEDHAIEASICKVLGSEALAFCADEGVQIFGGAGFIEEYPVAGFYRDERINRIFEGTNEINRLIIGGTLLKKAILEELPIRDQIYHRMKDFLPSLTFSDDHELSSEIAVIETSRSLMLDTLHKLILKYGQDLKNEQWALEPLADIVISLSVMQMGFTRYNQLSDGEHKNKMNQVVRYSIYKNFNILRDRINTLIPYICDSLELKDSIDKINNKIHELDYNPDSIAMKKSICEELYKNGKYYLG